MKLTRKLKHKITVGKNSSERILDLNQVAYNVSTQIVTDTIERMLREQQRIRDQHGPVRIIVQNGKKVGAGIIAK